MTVLVVGATGSIGKLVVDEAIRQGHSVRALVRDSRKARQLHPEARVIVGDVTRPETLSDAVAGVDAIVFTLGSDGGGKVGAARVDYGGVRNILTALGSRKARIALMTAIGVTNRTGSYNRSTEAHDWKRRSERLARASGLPYTIVRPGWFDYNGPNEHQLELLQGDKRQAGDPSDGAVARHELIRRAHLRGETNMTKVIVVIGAGQIGRAIARRVGVGKHVSLSDMRPDNARAAAEVLGNAGYETSVATVDVSSRESVHGLVETATKLGDITGLIHAAGASPTQASPATVLKVDLYGTALVLERFGSVIADGGAGVVISSQSRHRLPPLAVEQNKALATAPIEELLALPFLQPDQVKDSLHAYQLSKRGNSLRVMAEAVR